MHRSYKAKQAVHEEMCRDIMGHQERFHETSEAADLSCTVHPPMHGQHDYYPEDNKERDKNKMKPQPERRKVPLSDDAKHDIQSNIGLSSSSSMNWGLRLIREGAAWEDDSPPYSTK